MIKSNTIPLGRVLLEHPQHGAVGVGGVWLRPTWRWLQWRRCGKTVYTQGRRDLCDVDGDMDEDVDRGGDRGRKGRVNGRRGTAHIGRDDTEADGRAHLQRVGVCLLFNLADTRGPLLQPELGLELVHGGHGCCVRRRQGCPRCPVLTTGTLGLGTRPVVVARLLLLHRLCGVTGQPHGHSHSPDPGRESRKGREARLRGFREHGDAVVWRVTSVSDFGCRVQTAPCFPSFGIKLQDRDGAQGRAC